MFVKVYRYQIRKRDLAKFTKVYRAAQRIYHQTGPGTSAFYIHPEGQRLTILDVGWYPSRRAFQTLMKKLDRDERVSALYAQCLHLMSRKRFVEEDFETPAPRRVRG